MMDEQDVAEGLDSEEIGDEGFSDDLPGENFVLDHPMGTSAGDFAEDLTVAVDSVATRDAREEPEGTGTFVVDQPIDLMARLGSEGFDTAAMMIAEPGEDVTDPQNLPAEVAAMHVLSEQEATDGIYDGML